MPIDVEQEHVQLGRLAMRVEGQLWVAYYAMSETMEGAIFLGSIRFAAVEKNKDRKQAFVELMRGIVSEVLAGKTGATPVWNEPKPAPESERGGNA